MRWTTGPNRKKERERERVIRDEIKQKVKGKTVWKIAILITHCVGINDKRWGPRTQKKLGDIVADVIECKRRFCAPIAGPVTSSDSPILVRYNRVSIVFFWATFIRILWFSKSTYS